MNTCNIVMLRPQKRQDKVQHCTHTRIEELYVHGTPGGRVTVGGRVGTCTSHQLSGGAAAQDPTLRAAFAPEAENPHQEGGTQLLPQTAVTSSGGGQRTVRLQQRPCIGPYRSPLVPTGPPLATTVSSPSAPFSLSPE